MAADPQDPPEAHVKAGNERGAVATEYGVIAGLIGIGMLVGAGLLGAGLGDLYTSIQQSVVSFFP